VGPIGVMAIEHGNNNNQQNANFHLQNNYNQNPNQIINPNPNIGMGLTSPAGPVPVYGLTSEASPIVPDNKNSTYGYGYQDNTPNNQQQNSFLGDAPMPNDDLQPDQNINIQNIQLDHHISLPSQQELNANYGSYGNSNQIPNVPVTANINVNIDGNSNNYL